MRSPKESQASWLALQPPSVRESFLKSLSPSELSYLQWDWNFWGRGDQQCPPDDWFVWLILSGRGWGKTRTAVENIAKMLRGPTPLQAPKDAPAVMSIIADTPFDMRQYTIDGPSGFLNVGPTEYRPIHEPSKKTLTWPNGAKALLFSAEDPESTRGASGSFFWWDELAKSRYANDGWDNMLFGMREGNPRGIVTTTPRPLKIIKDLKARKSTHVTIGSTWDNKANLSPVFYREVIEPLVGTRKGRQEIDGEILDDVPGALWTREMIDQCLVKSAPDMQRIVVAVDPSGTKGEEDNGDDIGIVAAGKGVDGMCYVLSDKTCKLSPAGWGRMAVNLYNDMKADRLVAEKNFGGAMVEAVIRSVDSKVSYKDVNASRGKTARAEPVAALYEQGRVKHVKSFSALEDQMCSMTGDGYMADGSPDRVDALVWAVTELMLGDGSNYGAWNL
jgi:phage terminase large subunit-like protein